MNKERHFLLFIFLFSFLIRFIFTAANGFNGFSNLLPVDSREYVTLSEKILQFDFNFDVGRFVRSPLYPLFLATFKLLFDTKWATAVLLVQIILSSLCSIFIYNICKLLFYTDRSKSAMIEENKLEGKEIIIGKLAAIFFACYIPTFMLVATFAIETLSLFLLLAALNYYLKYILSAEAKYLIIASLLLVITYMGRSEIAFIFPLLFLHQVIYFRLPLFRALKTAVPFIVIYLLFTLPWGLYNLQKHGLYISSSNPSKYQFFAFNSQWGYYDAVATPAMNTKEYTVLHDNPAALFPEITSILQMPVKDRPDAFLSVASQWIKNNFRKFLQIKVANFVRLITPGVSYSHNTFARWLLSFIFSLPFELFCVFGLVKGLRVNKRMHILFLSWFIAYSLMLIFISFGERYRAYGIEVFFLIYSAYYLSSFIESWLSRYRLQ